MKKLNNFKPLFFFFSRAECEETREDLEQGLCPGAGRAACNAGRCWGTGFLTSLCPEWEQTEEAQICGWRGGILEVHGGGSRTDSCHPQMRKVFPLAGKARGLRHRCQRDGWACIPGGIYAENCWRAGGPRGSKECTGSLQAKVLSSHWELTEQKVEKIPEHPSACAREWNVPCFALVKPQVQRIDQMEENMSPESIPWALQPSHILCSALT